jgi:hypothetical protein
MRYRYRYFEWAVYMSKFAKVKHTITPFGSAPPTHDWYACVGYDVMQDRVYAYVKYSRFIPDGALTDNPHADKLTALLTAAREAIRRMQDSA